MNVVLTKGAPLPFAFDILATAHQYGNRAFTQYPADIPDYFKQTFLKVIHGKEAWSLKAEPCAQQAAT